MCYCITVTVTNVLELKLPSKAKGCTKMNGNTSVQSRLVSN